MLKFCPKCKTNKPFEDFYKNKNNKDGLSYQCKECVSIYQNQNKDLINKHRKTYRKNSKEKRKIYNENNKDKIQQYYINNRDKIIKRQKSYNLNRIKEDPLYYQKWKIRGLICNSFRRVLNGVIVKSKKTEKILGCSFEEFKQYLESQFKPEMNWENWGEIWEIDHKTPLKQAQTEEDLYKLNHYSNLQPLFKTTEIAENLGYNEIGNRNKK